MTALDVAATPCPWCHAKPDAPCRDPRGKKYDVFHDRRHDAARERRHRAEAWS